MGFHSFLTSSSSAVLVENVEKDRSSVSVKIEQLAFFFLLHESLDFQNRKRGILHSFHLFVQDDGLLVYTLLVCGR